MDREEFGKAYYNFAHQEGHEYPPDEDVDEIFEIFKQSGLSFEDWAREQMPDKVFAQFEIKVTGPVLSGEDVEYLEDAIAEVLRKFKLQGRMLSETTGNELQIENEERHLHMNRNKFLNEIKLGL